MALGPRRLFVAWLFLALALILILVGFFLLWPALLLRGSGLLLAKGLRRPRLLLVIALLLGARSPIFRGGRLRGFLASRRSPLPRSLLGWRILGPFRTLAAVGFGTLALRLGTIRGDILLRRLRAALLTPGLLLRSVALFRLLGTGHSVWPLPRPILLSIRLLVRLGLLLRLLRAAFLTLGPPLGLTRTLLAITIGLLLVQLRSPCCCGASSRCARRG